MQQPNNNIYQQLPAIVKRYQKPSSLKATIQVLNSFLPFFAIWVAMYLWRDVSIWLTIALAVVNAFFLVRIFIIQHDCGHQSFTASRKANNIIGSLSSFLTFIPYRYWASVFARTSPHTRGLWHHCHLVLLHPAPARIHLQGI